MKVLVTDAEYSSLDIEAEVLAGAGYELVVASCRTPEEVIEAAAGVDALLVQYAPITADVFEAVPQLKLVSRYGVGVDAVDTEAARKQGVWVCNVPDYGTTEVALQAVAMLLALLRNVAGHDREVRAGHWDYHLGGQLRRPSSLTLGVVGLVDAWRRSGQRPGLARLWVTTHTCRIPNGRMAWNGSAWRMYLLAVRQSRCTCH
jgi:D-3-phosphoglycerate dehydrogenase / 2-oxoglutarate reductase